MTLAAKKAEEQGNALKVVTAKGTSSMEACKGRADVGKGKKEAVRRG